MKKEQFDVIGMSCSACAVRIEKAVSKITGVKEVSVNLLKNSMTLSCDDTCDSADIITAVKNAGYDAILKSDKVKKNNQNSATDTADIEYKDIKKRLWLSLIFTLPLFYITMGKMIGLPIPSFLTGTQNALIYAFTQFLLVMPVVFINSKYYKNGFKALLHGAPNMDSLIAIGSSAAIVYGVYAIYKIGLGFGCGDLNLVNTFIKDLYFESAATIVTLITLGKTLEAKAKRKTSDAINKLINLAPKMATVLRAGTEITIPTEEIVVGDIVIVKAGETIAVDGRIIEGFASIDQSALTGESIPVEKGVGDKVIGATISKSGYIKICAEKVGNDTALAQIIKLVDDATASKAPIAKLADKVSGVFVPTVITISVISLIVWLILGYGLDFSLSIAISVLVISCPCALGLATPTAIMVGTGKGASNGILIKSAEALEIARKVNTVVFDKTGTITEGKPTVTDVIAFEDENLMLSMAASLEYASEHPIAVAIVNEAKNRGVAPKEVKNFTQVAGGGIIGEIEGTLCCAGNRRLMEEYNLFTDKAKEIEENFSSQGKTPIFIAKGQKLLGVIAVADRLKEGSIRAIKELTEMGIEVVMLTGDNEITAKAIAKELGTIKVIAELFPQDKEKEIRRLQNEGKIVAMVGDGINDAPALARANVGIAIGAGTDIAIDSADIVLMKNDLTDVVKAIRLSRATIRNVKQNLFWAFFYNIIGIPIASGVLYLPLSFKLNPMVGALAMSMSSVFVVTNALRLKGINLNKKQKQGEDSMQRQLIINGMACPHCANHVKEALSKIDGVISAEVNLNEKCATVVLSKEVSGDIFKSVIENAGYELIKVN